MVYRLYIVHFSSTANASESIHTNAPPSPRPKPVVKRCVDDDDASHPPHKRRQTINQVSHQQMSMQDVGHRTKSRHQQQRVADDDGVDHFFMCIALSVKALPRHLIREVKIKILEVVSDFECHNDNCTKEHHGTDEDVSSCAAHGTEDRTETLDIM